MEGMGDSTAEYRDGKGDVQLLKKKGFRNGSVLRVKMHNFLTFDDCEVFPGPRLNVILGPNGTGKSTVTHAICLACCGSPATVGRSPDLAQFVKHGKEGFDSYTEVDLLRSDTIVCVRRTINSDNKGSKWSIDGKKAAEKDVKLIMVELAIDVDNLCSFMPQDKVGAFTQSSAKETLQKTLQSIKLPSDPERTLYDEQRDLANIEETKREQERVLEAKKSGFLVIMQQMTAMQVEVDRMKSRKADKEKLELYEIKLIYEESKEGKRIIEMKQNDVNAAEEELTQAKLAVDPLEKKERELRKKQAVYIKNEENMNNVISKSELKVKRMKEKVEDLENIIEESHSELKLLDEIRKRDENELTKIEATIKGTTEEIGRRTKNIPQANLNLSEIKMKLIELNSNEATLSDDISDTSNELNKYHNEIQTKTKKMGELKNAKQIFRQKLNNMMNSNKYDNKKIRDCLTLMDYFDREQDTLIANGTLRGEVFGPVGFYMKVSSPECVIMIEKSVPLKKLLSFVSSCDEDDRFVRSVIKRLNVDIDNFCMKNLEMPRPTHTENSLKSFKDIGVIGYLGNELECPPIIRAYLAHWHSLHNILWAKQTRDTTPINENHYNLLCPDNVNSFRLYVHTPTPPNSEYNIMEFNGSKSRFSRKMSTRCNSACSPANVQSVLSASGEIVDDQKSRLESNIAEIKAKMTPLEDILKEKKRLNQETKNQIYELKDQRNRYQKDITDLKKIENILVSETKKRDETMKKLSRGVEKEKKTKMKEYEDSISNMITAIEETIKVCNTHTGYKVEGVCVSMARQGMVEQIRSVSDAIAEAREGLEVFVRKVKDAQKSRDESQRVFDTAQAELKRIEVEVGGLKNLRALHAKVLVECTESDIAKISVIIEELKERIDNSIDNPEVLQRFSEIRAKALVIEAELRDLQVEFDNQEGRLQERAEEWQKWVEAIQSKLDTSFKNYMSLLQYMGEVQLRVKDTFLDWEMQMRVKFRQESGLVDLSGSRHSGGERAVSTVMYLMALQDLTSAPFRVVDEINQGMDERNERLVFDQIVQSCCGGTGEKPQYFLVSPKLLQGLRAMENDDVTVLLVWNGPGVCQKWQMNHVMKALKRERGEDSEDEEIVVVKEKRIGKIKPEKAH